MKVFPRTATPENAADPRTFVGEARVGRQAESADGTPVVVYRVEFADGGRTNWHTHSGAQWLFVVEGRIRVQGRDGPPRDVEAGDVVVIAPHEKHWHGAAPGSTGAHLAVNVDCTTTWLDAVSDDEYRARR